LYGEDFPAAGVNVPLTGAAVCGLPVSREAGAARGSFMSNESKWVYDGPAGPGAGDGYKCLFCGKQLVDESHPAHWVVKAEEDNQDTDYVVEDGYAHRACHEDKLAQQRKSRFTLPEVPK
jgi:hypothetical protein